MKNQSIFTSSIDRLKSLAQERVDFLNNIEVNAN